MENEQILEPTETEKGGAPFALKVRYNHEDIVLSEDRARELSQKGLNYDSLMERYNTLKNDEGLSFLDSLASSCGCENRQELLSLLNDIPLKTETASDDGIEEFFRKYEGVKPEDIPSQVIEEFSAGVPLSAAYEKFIAQRDASALSEEVERLNAILSERKINEQNGMSSPGSLSSYGAAEGDIYGEEELSSLSEKEISKNLDKALRSMSYWTEKRR